MSEFDSRSGNRKGFVRDVMRRISANPDAEGEGPGEGEDTRESTRAYRDELEDLQNAIRLFGADSPEFRRRLDRMLAEYEALRRRYQLTREQFSDAERQNERLVGVLQEAKQQIELLKEEVDKLCAPPNNYGVFAARQQGRHGRDPWSTAGQMRVNVHPNLDAFQFEEGQHVRAQRGLQRGRARGLRLARRDRLDRGSDRREPGDRARAHGRRARRDARRAAAPREAQGRATTSCTTPRTHYAFEKLPKSAVEEVVLEEIPDVTYERHRWPGRSRSRSLRDSVELPVHLSRTSSPSTSSRRPRASCSTGLRAAERP